MPIEYRLPVPSAQVKSAVLLAGLNTPGATTVIEPLATRDHTERMLRHFGATVDVEAPRPAAASSRSTASPSCTAPISRARRPLLGGLSGWSRRCSSPGSDVTIEGVGINPLRTGLFDTLLEMGADIEFRNERDDGGEPVADLVRAREPPHRRRRPGRARAAA